MSKDFESGGICPKSKPACALCDDMGVVNMGYDETRRQSFYFCPGIGCTAREQWESVPPFGRLQRRPPSQVTIPLSSILPSEPFDQTA